MKPWLYGLSVLSILLITSCFGSKKIVETNEEESEEISDLYIAYAENKLMFDQLEFTANVQFDNGDMNLGFSSVFRIQNNEKIWASFKKFGFEAARLLMTPDSIFVINRLQSTYVAEDIKALQSKAGIPLDFQDLEQLLIGGSFWEANLIESNDSTLFKTEVIQEEVIEVKHLFDDRNMVKESVISSQNQGDLTVQYDDYTKTDQVSLAFDRRFLVKRTGMNVILDFETLKFDPNSSKTFPFDIPANYTRQSM